LRAFQRGEPLTISVDGQSHTLIPEDLDILPRSSGALVVQDGAGFFAAIDPEITPELRREGLAREFISRVQRMRKEAGFAMSDRITLVVAGAPEVVEAVEVHRGWIADEVLATDLVIGSAGGPGQSNMTALDLDGLDARVSLTRND
jgi:isoleucyl-tRNA synthetase